MANTITNTKIIDSPDRAVIYVALASDGAEETGTVIYDSSAFVGVDPLNCKILRAWVSVSAGVTARANLLFDATTDVLALDLPAVRSKFFDFRDIGGLPNTGGAGKTGDILLTTTGLEAGDSMTIVLDIQRQV